MKMYNLYKKLTRQTYRRAVVPVLILSLFCSCERSAENPVMSDDGMATVSLSLDTRAISAGGLLHDSSDKWFINGELFPQEGSTPSVALMIYSREQQRYVYSKLTPFIPEGNGTYRTKVRIPAGETDFYALYVSNQFPGSPEIPYYTSAGTLHPRMPWDFHSIFQQDVQMDDFRNAGFPVFFEKSGDTYTIPSEAYYNGASGTGNSGKDVFWYNLNSNPWTNPILGIGNKAPLFTVSGKLTATVIPVSKDIPSQSLAIPLYRDFPRFKFFIASTSDHKGKACLEAVAFLYFPVVTSPSFREDDAEAGLGQSALKGVLAEKAGSYSYGYNYAYPSSERAIRQAPVKSGPSGGIDYDAILRQEGYELVFPQYLAPYLPRENAWQAKLPHPKLLLKIGYYEGEAQPVKIREYLIDIGEKGNGLKYDGAIYPNRDYRVFLILPASIEQDLIYRIEPWKTRETNIPDFQ